MGLKKSFYKFKRKQEIRRVLIKYGLNYWISSSGLKFIKQITRKFHKSSDYSLLAKKLRLAIEELGPTFIKFGQILSTRVDMLPAVFIKELEKLQDQTIPFKEGQSQEILKKEFKRPLEEIFKDFEKVPIASASLSQVHRAILLNRDVVAVKVQRPDIKEIINLDLEILEELLASFDNYIYKKWHFHPQSIIQEIKKTTKKEIDFLNEAYNYERFRKNFKDIEYIKIPKVNWDLTTKKVLVTQFIKGIKINKINDKKYKNIFDCEKVAEYITKAFLKQILEDRFFHADPHPANILIVPPKTIVMLDVGMVGIIDKETMTGCLQLFDGLINNNLESIVYAFESLRIIKETTDEQVLRHNIMEMMNRYIGIPVENLRIKKIGDDVLEIVKENDLRVPTNLILIIKSLSIIEIIIKQLDDDFLVMPFLKEFLKEKKFSKTLKSQGIQFFQESFNLIQRLPQDLIYILNKLRSNKMKFIFESHQIEQLKQEIEYSSYQRLLGLIIVALIISSSLFLIYEQLILSFIGYGLTLILIISLLIIGKKRKNFKNVFK